MLRNVYWLIIYYRLYLTDKEVVVLLYKTYVVLVRKKESIIMEILLRIDYLMYNCLEM